MAVVTQGCEHVLSLSIFVIPVGAGKVLLQSQAQNIRDI